MAPPDPIKSLVKKLPNEETYFSSIQSHGGLIYVFKSYHNRKNIQQIDITGIIFFTSYLYSLSMDGRCLIRTGAGVQILRPPGRG